LLERPLGAPDFLVVVLEPRRRLDLGDFGHLDRRGRQRPQPARRHGKASGRIGRPLGARRFDLARRAGFLVVGPAGARLGGNAFREVAALATAASSATATATAPARILAQLSAFLPFDAEPGVALVSLARVVAL